MNIVATAILDHVGQTGALASETGQGLGRGLVLTAARLGTASVLALASTQSQGNTNTAARIDIASNAVPRTAVFTKRSVISGRRRPGV